jgi:hypothetical protein
MPIFDADVVTAVLKHMNGDHEDDNLLIARAFGHPDADSATMTGLDELGGFWNYTLEGEAHELGVPWAGPISERREIRREVVVLYDAACARLGVEPRPHE